MIMNESNPTFLELYKIEPKVCDDLIEYYNDNIEYKSEGTIDDPVSYTHLTLPTKA